MGMSIFNAMKSGQNSDPPADPSGPHFFLPPENRSRSGPRTVCQAWEVAAVLENWEIGTKTPREKTGEPATCC